MKFKLNESSFRPDVSIGAKKLLCGMEELGHELKQGDEYFDLLYSYISKEDLDEYRNEPITESSESTQCGVHQFSTESIIFRGTEEECQKYIDERPELWDDAEVYMMTPGDPHYLTEAYSNDTVELDYKDLEFIQYGEQLAVDQWDEYEIKTDWIYHVDKDDLYAFILDECLTADEYPAAFTDEFDINNPADWAAYSKWLDSNYAEIYAKYADKILYNFEYAAMLDAQKKYDPEDDIDFDTLPGGHDDYKFDEALYSSDKEYVAKECSYEMAREIAQKARRALRLPDHEVEMLEHDINNLRSNEWVDTFAKLSDRSEVKKLFFTYAVEEEELDDLNEGLWNLSPNFKKVWNKLEEYSIAHPGYFIDRRDDFYNAIDNLSEEGIFEIPAEYCEDPENCTEDEAERFINDFIDAIGNIGRLRLYHADLREDLAQENNICCICNEPYEGYGNNAEPVCSGRCCDKCNIERVIPMRFKMMKESLNEGNPVSGKIPESIDSFLQDIAQMYQTIDYGDIMDHDYSEEDIKALRSLRRKFREEAQYEGSEEAEAAMNDIAEKVAAILKAKNEALLETDESGNDEIEVNCDGEDCAELITVSVDAEGPHYCCNCAPKYMKQEALTEEKNSEKLFRKFPELRKSITEEVEEVSPRYYVYKNEYDVVSDEFDYEEDAIEWAKENDYPIVKIHRYYIDDEDGRLNPAGTEIVWEANTSESEELNEEEIITENLPDGTYKITYYLSTATRNRRPETREDIDNDYRVDTVHAADDFEAMKEAFRIQRAIDESDIDFEMEDYDIKSVDDFIKYFDDTDWGDGSILMLKIEGPNGVIYDTGYDKDTFIKELDDNIEYQKKMIADMEEIDPATAKAWREILGLDEGLIGDISVNLDASGSSVGFLGGTAGTVQNEALIDNIDVNLDASGSSVGFLRGQGGQVLNSSYDMEDDDMDEAFGAGLAALGAGIMGASLINNTLGEDVDDSYDYDEMDETLSNDAEIKRFRRIYGVE